MTRGLRFGLRVILRAPVRPAQDDHVRASCLDDCVADAAQQQGPKERLSGAADDDEIGAMHRRQFRDHPRRLSGNERCGHRLRLSRRFGEQAVAHFYHLVARLGHNGDKLKRHARRG